MFKKLKRQIKLLWPWPVCQSCGRRFFSGFPRWEYDWVSVDKTDHKRWIPGVNCKRKWVPRWLPGWFSVCDKCRDVKLRTFE